jgi:hypothetical protein
MPAACPGAAAARVGKEAHDKGRTGHAHRAVRLGRRGGREQPRGVPPDELTTRPFPGGWSAAEIVHHLADSEMISAIRLRTLIAEQRPVIHGYDQEAFATLGVTSCPRWTRSAAPAQPLSSSSGPCRMRSGVRPAGTPRSGSTRPSAGWNSTPSTPTGTRSRFDACVQRFKVGEADPSCSPEVRRRSVDASPRLDRTRHIAAL